MMWNGESAVPSGMLPTIIDAALGMRAQQWLNIEFDEQQFYANRGLPTQQPGSSASSATAAPCAEQRAVG